MKNIICCIFLLLAQLHVWAQDSLLEKSITSEDLQKVLLNDDSWVNYPAYDDRAAWEEHILPDVRKRILKAGEEALTYQWKPDLATDYLAFKRSGKILTGRKNHTMLLTLTLAELVEGKGRFMDQIINGVWFLCEVGWLHSAHAYFQKDQSGLPDPDEPTVELVVADIGAQMAWTYYFLHKEFDKVSPLIAKRIRNTVYERLIDPYFARSDYWWMGWTGKKVNNWNVWINYNTLQAVLLLEKDPVKRAAEVYRLMCSVDRYIDCQQQDGACEEGPTYFGHAGANLLKFLDLVYRATGGTVSIFKNEKIRNIARYISRVHINDRYFVNFSDAAAVTTINPGAVYHYGKCIGDASVMGFASDFARNIDWGKSVHKGAHFARLLDDVLMAEEILNGKGKKMDEYAFYFNDSELLVARDGLLPDKGFCFAAHGSHNGVSHNHNDVGSCMLYYNGRPVLVDIGVENYSRKTFSSKRYTIWTMQSAFHNLPVINGMEQHQGQQYKAEHVVYKDNGRKAFFSADIAKAYPEETGVEQWVRSYTLLRGREFVVDDSWILDEVKGATSLNFMTCCEVELQKDRLLLKDDRHTLELLFDRKVMTPVVETKKFTDSQLKSSWPKGVLYRICFEMKTPGKKGSCRFKVRVVK